MAGFVKRLTAPEWQWFSREIRFLEQSGAAAIPALSELLEDDRPEIRRRASAALGYTKSREVFPILRRAAEDSDLFATREALSACTKFGFEGFEALVAILEDPDERLRLEVNHALHGFQDIFPADTSPVERLGPAEARVNSGFVLTPAGEVKRPYLVKVVNREQNGRLLHVESINDIVIFRIETSLKSKVHASEDAQTSADIIAHTLSEGGYFYLYKPGRYLCGRSAAQFKAILKIIGEAKRTDFERACWLSGYLSGGMNADVELTASVLAPNSRGIG
jgi:hypothetical protein